jgi:hypothetical protein
MDSEHLDVPPPCDALFVGQWEIHDGQFARYFYGSRRGFDVPVQIVGIQDSSGDVIARMVRVGREHAEMDLAGVQDLIRVLTDASDELSRLTYVSDTSNQEPDTDPLGDLIEFPVR